MKNLWKPALGVFLITSLGAEAQMVHTPGMHGAEVVETLPTEPGQGAFAAISEIVTLLSADPHTDWDAVDIDALRDHLVDMDNLVTHTEVTAKTVEGGLEMTVSLAGVGGLAASRMVPAHGPVLAAETGWNVDLQTGDEALIWTVTSDNDTAKIRALGFYGLMATGDHHREHHIGMAKGQMVH